MLGSRAVLLTLLTGLAATTVEAGTVELPLQVGGAFSVPAVSLRESRYVTTLRQQYDFSCGSAALATLLTHHYGHPVGEDQVFTEMYRTGDQSKIKVEGFSLLDMKRFLEAHGYSADGFQESLARLAEVGIPAIVLINEAGYNHFVVIKGIRDGRVLFGDPATGTRALPIAQFEAMWVNSILFVINNRQERAGFNLASDWRVVPGAPITQPSLRNGLAADHLPKFGPGDF